MRRLASALHAFALLACAACSAATPGGGPADGGPVMPRVELGTGDVSFEPIAERGGTIELVLGPQGGYHLVVAVRVWDLAPDRLGLVYEVVRPDGELLSRTPFVLDAARFVREGDHLARYGDTTVLDVPGPDVIAGQPVIVRVTATAQDGASASDERSVTVVDAL